MLESAEWFPCRSSGSLMGRRAHGNGAEVGCLYSLSRSYPLSYAVSYQPWRESED